MAYITTTKDLLIAVEEGMGSDCKTGYAERVTDYIIDNYDHPSFGDDWDEFLDEIDYWDILEEIEKEEAKVLQISQPVGVDRVRLFVLGDHMGYGTYEHPSFHIDHAPTQESYDAILKHLIEGKKTVEIIV
jgi:hypothetical protein